MLLLSLVIGCGTKDPGGRFGTIIRNQADADALEAKFSGVLVILPDPQTPIRFDRLATASGSVEIVTALGSTLDFVVLEELDGALSVSGEEDRQGAGRVAFGALESVTGSVLASNSGTEVDLSRLQVVSEVEVTGYNEISLGELRRAESLVFDMSQGSFRAPQLETIGTVILRNSSLTVEFVPTTIAHIEIEGGVGVSFEQLERVTDRAQVVGLPGEGSDYLFPALAFVERLHLSLETPNAGFFILPALTAAGEITAEFFSAPLLREVERDFVVTAYDLLTVPKLERVGGDLHVTPLNTGGAQFETITEVGATFEVNGRHVIADTLRRIGGDLVIRNALRQSSLAALEEIHGRILIEDTDNIGLDLPELHSLGYVCAAPGDCLQTLEIDDACESPIQVPPEALALSAPKLANVAGALQIIGNCSGIDVGTYANPAECGPVCRSP